MFVISVAGRSGFLSSLYYALCSRNFRREHSAVLCGRSRFAAELANPAATSALLRRNIHRLEKGLLMRPRRDVFAVSYIHEAMEFYERVVSNPRHRESYNADELKWAHDVLSSYFTVVGSHPKIDAYRKRFQQLPGLDSGCASRAVPYRRDLSVAPSVTIEALQELAQRRRSVRWFLPRPVSRESIRNAVAVALQSPSACNRQPFVFRVVDDPKLVQRVASISYGTVGYSGNIPVIIVLVGRLRNYFDERDRHLIYIDTSLAAMGLVYALEAQGLSSCCINWPDVEARELEIAQVLGLDPDERPIMLVAVGYPDPDGLVAFSQKKTVDQICRFNLE